MEFVQPIRDKKQIDSIKKILKATNLRDYCLFILGINSGLRISDLLKLRIEDILDDRSRIKDRVSIRETKTGKIKDFPVGDTARKAVQEYLKSREYQLSDPLFLSRKGENALKRQQAYKIIHDAARAVGIKEKIGTHTLRLGITRISQALVWQFCRSCSITLLQVLRCHISVSHRMNWMMCT